MQKNRKTNGSDQMSANLLDARALMEAHRVATENTMRIANAACHYTLSLNRAWLDLCESRLDEYLDLPKRFVNAQTALIEQAFDHYQESMQKLGSLTAKATRDAQSAVWETEAAGEGQPASSNRIRERWAGEPSERKPDTEHR